MEYYCVEVTTPTSVHRAYYGSVLDAQLHESELDSLREGTVPSVVLITPDGDVPLTADTLESVQWWTLDPQSLTWEAVPTLEP